MSCFRFKKIDAFTGGLSSGNPAACVYLEDISDITPAQMQQIARELKGYVNEVVYVFTDKDSYLLKYYSSECEVYFCGHGTIAAMYDLIINEPLLIMQEKIRIKVKQEYLDVINDIPKNDCVYISAPQPAYQKTALSIGDVSEALEMSPSEIDNRHKISLVNAGLNTLIVPIHKLRECINIDPQEIKLRDFCLNHDIDIILVYTQETSNKASDYRTRVFAPKFGYLEDPATGSGNSAFGYYLLEENQWDGQNLVIEQNASYDNPNLVKLGTLIKQGKINVLFGGGAQVRVDGKYLLHE